MNAPTINWVPNPMQARALACPYPEILFGGSRGGGKSEEGLAWLTHDNQDPRLRQLVLRKNYEDLKDWIDRAETFFAPLGAKLRDGDFYWPKGGILRTGHYKDDKSFQKYVGINYHRILIEELNLIPREENYLKLLGSLRSTDPDRLPAQIQSNCNPSDEGFYWIKKRWNLHGIPSEPVITKDSTTGLMRAFIPSKLQDNPYLMKDANYRAMLDGLPDGLREGWRDGSWEDPQISGAYYTNEMNQAEREGRVKLVPIDRLLKVHTVWDLGVSKGNAMTILLVQRVKGETKIVAAYANEGLGVTHYAAWLQEFQRTHQIVFGKHFAPFDIKNRERSTGMTTKDIMKAMGLVFEDVPMLDINSGIEKVRLMFPRVWINKPYCEQAVIGFKSYQHEWDEKMLMYKPHPLHNWASNWGDALRYLAIIEDKLVNDTPPRYVQPPYVPMSPLELVDGKTVDDQEFGQVAGTNTGIVPHRRQ